MITFGTDSTVAQRFGRTDPSPEDLKLLVQGLPESQGPPDFDEVLEDGPNIFEGEGLRPNALKVGTVSFDIDVDILVTFVPYFVLKCQLGEFPSISRHFVFVACLVDSENLLPIFRFSPRF